MVKLSGGVLMVLTVTVAISAWSGGPQQPGKASGPSTDDQVKLGRQLVIEHDCGGCHGGGPNPAAEGYLAGIRSPEEASKIGPFTTRADNITPDSATGIGRYTERQIFNSLRYGLAPAATPDVTITSTTPGQGNFPATPKYLAPPMPWASWRHMTDQELWAIAAYLKRGVLPVSNKVAESEGPPDFWADAYKAEKIGTYPAPAYPTANEVAMPNAADADREKIMRGRFVVLSHACADCHGGGNNPAAPGYLAGMMDPAQQFDIGPFKTRPRNLTPDNSASAVSASGRSSTRCATACAPVRHPTSRSHPTFRDRATSPRIRSIWRRPCHGRPGVTCRMMICGRSRPISSAASSRLPIACWTATAPPTSGRVHTPSRRSDRGRPRHFRPRVSARKNRSAKRRRAVA
jgi:mono/diheme cytochrome c family protein